MVMWDVWVRIRVVVLVTAISISHNSVGRVGASVGASQVLGMESCKVFGVRCIVPDMCSVLVLQSGIRIVVLLVHAAAMYRSTMVDWWWWCIHWRLGVIDWRLRWI